MHLNEKTNNQLGLTRILFNLGNVYSDLNQYKNSNDCFERGIKISDKLGDNRTKAKYLAAIGNNYLGLKNYSKALEYCSESQRLNTKKVNDDGNLAFSFGIMGEVYLEMASAQNNNSIILDKAKSSLDKALELHQKVTNLRVVSYDYAQLSSIEELKGNSKTALAFYKKSILYKDSIFNTDNKETIKNLEDKRTIELRDKQIQLNKLSLEAKEKQKWYFIIGLSLLGIIGILLFYQSRSRQKTNQKLALLNSELDSSNKVKARFFSILNHDLRSPISNLIHFLHLQKESPELLDIESKKRMENKTITGVENLLNSMEDILLWSKGQMENFQPQPKKISVATLFEDTKNHFSSVENISISFENSENIQLISDENYLKTIIRNLTGNALKALEKTTNATIAWKAWEHNGQNYLSVTDNGPGTTLDKFKALYDDTEVVGIKTGLGLHLIRDLAKAIDCKIEVESKPNEGTIFILSFA